MSITRSQIARQLMAGGGRMSETAASYSSPTARAADDRFSPASDSGNGGGNPPITIQNNIPNYPEQGLISKLTNKLGPYAVGYAGTVLGGPFAGKKFYDDAKEEAEKRQQAENLVPNAMLSNSQVFSIPGSFQQAYNKQYGIPNTPVTPPTFTGGDNEPIIPRMQMIAETPTDVDNTLSDFDLYMQGITSANPYRFTLDPRFAAAEGGVARQAYGLGSLVRKATKAVKKVLKSDIGKAALLYGAGTYLGGLKAFGGSGLGAAQKFGFKNFGGRLLNPTGTDGIANLLNPFRSTGGGYKLPFVQTEEQKSAELAKKIDLIEKSALSDSGKEKLKDSLVTKSLNIGTSEIPGYVKYGIPLAMLATYGATKKEKPDDLNQEIAQNYTDNSGLAKLYASLPEYRFQVEPPYRLAKGGRIGYEEGGDIDPANLPMSKEGLPTYEDIETGEEVEYPYENKEMSSAPDIDAELFQMYLDAVGSGQIPRSTTFDQYKELMNEMSFEYRDEPYGPFNRQERTMANEGGLMSLGGNEMDLRGGGFVPIGKQEKADDVPARLSKNEFVFTADAVRAAGGGDVDKGADLMYKTMKDLESRVG